MCVFVNEKKYIYNFKLGQVFISELYDLNTLNNSTLCQHYMFEILCLHFNILKAGGHSRKANNTNLIDALNTLCISGGNNL